VVSSGAVVVVLADMRIHPTGLRLVTLLLLVVVGVVAVELLLLLLLLLLRFPALPCHAPVIHHNDKLS